MPTGAADPGGLDVAALHGMLKGFGRRVEHLGPQVAEHLAAQEGYVAWSGGKDSTVVVHLASQADPNVPVVWFDSGLEFPETGVYIREIADRLRLNLHVIPAVPDALSVLEASGGWSHLQADHPECLSTGGAVSLHDVLISVPSGKAHAVFGSGELSGMRAAESAGRRKRLAAGRGRYSRADGSQVYAPIWDWSDRDVHAYLNVYGVRLNPVYDRLRQVGATGRSLRVGLVLDGNGLEYGRAVYLRRGWPDLWAQIADRLPRLHEWS